MRQIVCDNNKCEATTPEYERSKDWRRVFISRLDGETVLDVEVCSDGCALEVVAAWAPAEPEAETKREPPAKRRRRAKGGSS